MAALHPGHAGRTTRPSLTAQPLGRRPVPGRRLELGPAGQVAHRSSSPTTSARRASTRSPSRTRPTRSTSTRGEDEPGAERPDHSRRFPRSTRSSTKQYGDDTRPPGLLGRRRLPTLWNEAPFRNNQDLFVLKDDYSAVFGKHLFKAGVLASTNAKNEDSQRQRLCAELGVLGLGGPQRLGRQHRQHPGRLPAQGHDLRLLRAISAYRQTPTRWKDLEFYVPRLLEGQPARDRGLRRCAGRCSTTTTPTTTRIRASYPALFNPALGNDPCNGLLHVPGTNPCPDGGLPGRHRRSRTARSRTRSTTPSPRASASPGTSTATARPPCARASGCSTCASG